MNRRELLAGLATMLPASAITVDVEAPIHAGDLVVLTIPERHATIDTMERLKAYIEQLLSADTQVPKPKVLVLTDGCTLQVHRGVAKVELPER
jgi:hypothetical protein